MKIQSILYILCSMILFTGPLTDASELKQGTWKLNWVWGILMEPNWFANHCELITFYDDLADYYINGDHKFSGSVDSLIARYYPRCMLSVNGDTLRFTRAQEQEDLPFSWEWVRYSDSLANFNGTWRWIETVGGFTGSSRTGADYFSILNVNGTNVIKSINDSVVFSGKRDSLFRDYRTHFNWIVVADTLIAFQKPQCCDMPCIFKWIRWTSGQAGVRVSSRSMVVSVNEKPTCFDIKGRKIVPGVESASGIHLLYNKDTRRINLGLYTSRQNR